ncbi:hypothetical protein [Streptomyces hokutonensis]
MPTAQSADMLPELTAREREVVAEVAGGLSNGAYRSGLVRGSRE